MIVTLQGQRHQSYVDAEFCHTSQTQVLRNGIADIQWSLAHHPTAPFQIHRHPGFGGLRLEDPDTFGSFDSTTACVDPLPPAAPADDDADM